MDYKYKAVVTLFWWGRNSGYFHNTLLSRFLIPCSMVHPFVIIGVSMLSWNYMKIKSSWKSCFIVSKQNSMWLSMWPFTLNDTIDKFGRMKKKTFHPIDISVRISDNRMCHQLHRKRKRKRSKGPTPTEKSKKQRDNIKTPPRILITQRLRTE